MVCLLLVLPDPVFDDGTGGLHPRQRVGQSCVANQRATPVPWKRNNILQTLSNLRSSEGIFFNSGKIDFAQTHAMGLVDGGSFIDVNAMR